MIFSTTEIGKYKINFIKGNYTEFYDEYGNGSSKKIFVNPYKPDDPNWQLDRPKIYTPELMMTNPYFYEIIDYLVESIIFGKILNIYDDSCRFIFIKEIGEISEEQKKENVAKDFFSYFKKKMNMLPPSMSWKKYVNEFNNEGKIKFWRRFIWGFIQEITVFCDKSLNANYIFSKEIYDFWISIEPNIDYFLEEAINTSPLLIKVLDKKQVKIHLKMSILNFENIKTSNNEWVTGFYFSFNGGGDFLSTPIVKNYNWSNYKSQRLFFYFKLFGEDREYCFDVKIPEAKKWIMKVITSFREQHKLLFSFNPDTFEVLEIT